MRHLVLRWSTAGLHFLKADLSGSMYYTNKVGPKMDPWGTLVQGRQKVIIPIWDRSMLPMRIKSLQSFIAFIYQPHVWESWENDQPFWRQQIYGCKSMTKDWSEHKTVLTTVQVNIRGHAGTDLYRQNWECTWHVPFKPPWQNLFKIMFLHFFPLSCPFEID